MRIKFTCPAGHKLKARSDKAGSKTVCPACGAEVVVPSLKEVPIQSAPAPAAATTVESSVEVPLAPPPATATLEGPDVSQTVKRPPLAPSTIRSKWAEESAAINGTTARKTPPPLRNSTAATSENGRQSEGGKLPPPLPSRLVQAPPLPPSAASVVAAAPQPASQPEAQGTGPTPAEPPSPEPRAAIRGYRPDRYQLALVYRLVLALLSITFVEAIPALSQFIHWNAPHFTFSSAPSWAYAVIMLCMLQSFYIVWLVTLPDWSTVWTMMIVYGAVSAVYGFAFAVCLLSPRDQELMLQLDTVRRLTPLWAAAMVLLTFLAAFMCGRTSTRWHRAYLAMVKAMGV